MRLLENRVAIITGAASKRGLGRATAKLFAEHGARVVILDLDAKAAEAAAATLAGSGHLGFVCDVTDRGACLAVVPKIIDACGGVDILVNNAGISQPLKLMEIKPENYNAVMDVCLRGTLNMTQAVVPHFRERKHGSIVNMASVAAQRGGGIFGGPHYSAAKGGVLGLTKASARELAPDGIRVNAICPSLIDTDIIHSAPGWTTEREAEVMASIPMGRPGQAHEVAGCCLFLASDLSSYVTGSEIDVNGGSHIH
ncbi:MAG: SDR family oxidoreductase [Hyphomicrobiaceae bacterium]|nr:SDR family oxidoreductase [Hyphomicrobiaceae bacterium]